LSKVGWGEGLFVSEAKQILHPRPAVIIKFEELQIMLRHISIKLSRYLIVLGLLAVLGETPVRLYGHIKWIEARSVEASQSDVLTFFDLAFGQNPVLPSPFGSLVSLFEPATPDFIQDIPLIIGSTNIPFMGRSLGGCGS
jgi:hypothetical protein